MYARAALVLGLSFATGACSSSTFSSSAGTDGGGGQSGAAGNAGSGGGSAGTSSGGAAGSGGTGASAGASGSAGAGGGAAGSGTAGASGAGGGIPCTAYGGQCNANEFCTGTGCGPGHCEQRPSETSTRNPVCGCDGVTYWNQFVAAHRGVSVKANGACTASANGHTCGGLAAQPCPTGQYCNERVQGVVGCSISDLGGTCWGMPDSCGGGTAIGPSTRECGGQCKSECELIKDGTGWYTDSSCPQ